MFTTNCLTAPRRPLLVLLCTLPLLAAVRIASAQSRVYGSIVDKNDQAIAQASVLLLNAKDSSLVKGMFSSPAGAYSFDNIRAGQYLLTSTFTGLRQVYTPAFPVTQDSRTLDMGKIKLSESAVQLSTVTVTARRPVFEQKIDRLVINVENTITAAGSTALDVLERSPGVVVDHQNNTIAMNGKDGVVIMINGKKNYMPLAAAVQMLAGMSANNIDRIELITTPPASMDAEGNAGYINIVLKENNNFGTNGSFSVTAGYGQGAVGAAATNFNHRKGKVNLFGDLSASLLSTTPYLSFYRRTTNGGMLTETASETDREATRTNYSGRLGLDYQLTKKTLLGVLVAGAQNRFTMEALNTNATRRNHLPDTSIRIWNEETNRWRNYSANLNLLQQLRQGEQLTVNLDYIRYHNRQPVRYDNAYYDGGGAFLFRTYTRSGKETPIHLWVGAADYTKKLGKKAGMEAGLKLTRSTFTNSLSFEESRQGSWVTIKDQTVQYRLEEQYMAAYTAFNFTASEKTNLKGGLRYEYTTSNLGTTEVKNIVDRKYGNFFPSFYLAHKLNGKETVNFSFSRRITRPPFNALAPFTYYVDPSTLVTGNPTLQPAIANMLKADYMRKKLLFSVTYTKESRTITGFQPFTDSVTNKSVFSPENLRDQQILSALVALPVDVAKWWSLQLNMTGLGQQINAWYKKVPVRLQQANLNVNIIQKFKLPKDWSAELSGFYRTRSLNGIFTTPAFGSLDVGIRKTLGKSRGTLVFNGSNILRTLVFKPYIFLPEQNLHSTNYMRFIGSTYKLTYTRSFGNTKLKERKERATASEEEKGRVQTQ